MKRASPRAKPKDHGSSLVHPERDAIQPPNHASRRKLETSAAPLAERPARLPTDFSGTFDSEIGPVCVPVAGEDQRPLCHGARPRREGSSPPERGRRRDMRMLIPRTSVITLSLVHCHPLDPCRQMARSSLSPVQDDLGRRPYRTDHAQRRPFAGRRWGICFVRLVVGLKPISRAGRDAKPGSPMEPDMPSLPGETRATVCESAEPGSGRSDGEGIPVRSNVRTRSDGVPTCPERRVLIGVRKRCHSEARAEESR